MANILVEIGSGILLFFLVFGMSATVELKKIRHQVGNIRALLIGVCMQFVVLPFLGFLSVVVFDLPAPVGITLLVITSSPGGSYSNWWCSLFNAELSLSVTMTALSTLLSTALLPANLILYSQWTYSSTVVEALDWTGLFVSLALVLSAISAGLVVSSRSRPTIRKRCYRMGNVAGLLLIVLSVTVNSSDHQASLWNQGARFFCGVSFPALLGIGIVTFLTSKVGLEKPERVAVTVESVYQNTGIATSLALTMFSGKEVDLATAIGVPLFYGMVEAGMLAIYCISAWQLGWTKAPPTENFISMLLNSYEVEGDDDTDADQEQQQQESSVQISNTSNGNVVLSKRRDEEEATEVSNEPELEVADAADMILRDEQDQVSQSLSRRIGRTLFARATERRTDVHLD